MSSCLSVYPDSANLNLSANVSAFTTWNHFTRRRSIWPSGYELPLQKYTQDFIFFIWSSLI